jgi:hypothetical protein
VNAALLTGSSYLDAPLPSTPFFWFVTAVDTRDRESEPSATVSATPLDTGRPAAPTGLVATPRVGSVELDWSDNGEADLAGYNVYRAFSETGTFTRLNTALVAPSAFTAAASAEIRSFYRVTAVDAAGNESDPSAVVSAIACPPVGCLPSGPGAGAAARRTDPRAVAFALTVAGDAAPARESVLAGEGVELAGTFTLELAGTRSTGSWRARSDWRLAPAAGTASAAGVALATFADGALCLRFADEYRAKTRGKSPTAAARGAFTLLGGTGEAARLLGRGHYAIALNEDGSLAYRGTARPARVVPPLPAECRALQQ